MGVSKNRGGKPPKMDGENNGSKPYEQMDDLGVFPPIFWSATQMTICFLFFRSKLSTLDVGRRVLQIDCKIGLLFEAILQWDT